MARDGSGTYQRTDGTYTGDRVFRQQRDAGRNVSALPMDIHANDIAQALTDSVAKDGQTALTGNLNLNDHKVEGLAAGTAATDAVNLTQLNAGAIQFVPAGQVAGTANAITLAPTPALTSYAVGRALRFLVKIENTGPVTLAISGLPAAAIQKPDGTALASADLKVGRHLTVVYNGAAFLSDLGGEGGGADEATVNRLIAAANLNAAKLTSGLVAPARLAASPANGDVLTIGSGGAASWESPFSVTAPVFFLEPSNGAVIIRWSLPNPPPGASITKRALDYRSVLSGGTFGTLQSRTITNNPHIEGGLVNGTLYEFWLQAEATLSDGTKITSRWVPTAANGQAAGAGARITPAAHFYETAVNATFTWPYAEPNVLVLAQGGRGGNSGTPSGGRSGSRGEAGGATTVTFGSSVVTGSGGAGGPANVSASQPGYPGALIRQVLSGVSSGSTFTIRIGTGGTGGSNAVGGGVGASGGGGRAWLIPV